MTRAATSVFVAVVLVFVLLGGPCLACATVIVSGVNHNCCHAKKGCQERPPGSLGDCASAAVDLTKVEQVSAALVVLDPSGLKQPLKLEVNPLQLDASYLLTGPVPFSPGDLCLLNSILTI